MGTPAFALPSLEALVDAGHEVCGVVTREDRPKGRRLIVSPTPVKARAVELGLPVLTPRSLADPSFMSAARRIAPDLVAVVAYGAFLPRPLWEMPPRGTINLHPSLLPRWRGASPVQYAILSGDAETGVTVAHLCDRVDAGDIIARERLPILPGDTGGSLSSKLAEIGGRLLAEAVDVIDRGAAERSAQDEEAATYAPRLRKTDGLIDWRMPAREIVLRIRAFNPWPGAYTYVPRDGGKALVKILRAEASAGAGGKPGGIVECRRDGIRVGAGEGCVVVRVVQVEGKRPVDAGAFLCGRPGLEGGRLG